MFNLNVRAALQRTLGALCWAVFVLILATATGCATLAHEAFQNFTFDLGLDGQNAVILDYRYGDDERAPFRASPNRTEPYVAQFVGGYMRVPKRLYVKWRSPVNGPEYETTIDLRNRIPAGLSEFTVTLMIFGPKLYVYLVYPDGVLRPADQPNIGPLMWRHNKIVQIYPG